MDTEKKDNLTDVVEALQEIEIPEDNLSEDSEQTALTEDGERITLDQEESENK